MQINISTRHGHLSDETQARVREKLERLPRFFERLTSIDLTVDLEHRSTPKVDLRVSAEHKHDFVATEQADELMVGVDRVVHKLEQQLRKYKEKLQDHHRGDGLRQQAPPADEGDDVESET